MKPTFAEIKEELKRGSGTEGAKLRIWAFFKLEPTVSEAVAFLKEEYGYFFGHSAIDPSQFGVDYTTKGATFIDKNWEKTVIPWSDVEKVIRNMVETGEYTIPKPEPKYGWQRVEL